MRPPIQTPAQLRKRSCLTKLVVITFEKIKSKSGLLRCVANSPPLLLQSSLASSQFLQPSQPLYRLFSLYSPINLKVFFIFSRYRADSSSSRSFVISSFMDFCSLDTFLSCILRRVTSSSNLALLCFEDFSCCFSSDTSSCCLASLSSKIDSSLPKLTMSHSFLKMQRLMACFKLPKFPSTGRICGDSVEREPTSVVFSVASVVTVASVATVMSLCPYLSLFVFRISH